MHLRWSLVAPLLLMLAGCGGESGGDADQAAETTGASAQLHQLVEEYFEEGLKLNPLQATFIGDNRYNDQFPNSLGAEYRQANRNLHKSYLERIDAIDPTTLEGQDRVIYESFRWQREIALEGFRYPSFLLPVNQFFSMPNRFALMGSGSNVQPFKTVEDYENWLKRIDGFVVWMDQAIANMREGAEQGIVQPRVLMERTLPQLANHLKGAPEETLFYRPVVNMPATIGEADRERLTAAYIQAISNNVVPAYRRLHDFIRDEYLPLTRETVGLSDLPGGEDWYAFLVRRTTSTDLSPAEIHQIGLDEVTRIHGEMEKVITDVGFEGDLKTFFEFLNTDLQFYYTERDDLINGYKAYREDIHPKALKIFYALPKADYEIRAVEPFREKSASGGSYTAATPDGSRPGIFYANAYDLSARPKWAMESLFLHEAVPGHHFQGSIAREIESLPSFMRFGGITAYAEGWALYAESLGKEMGALQDPYQYFGVLNAELWRAIRLVVDTGYHHHGWTRQQVLDFMYENSAVKESRAVSEAERYIAIPSQALAYKIGQLKIRELRTRAEEQLGDAFDVKAFHQLVLDTGRLPLGVLEAKVDRWIAQQQN